MPLPPTDTAAIDYSKHLQIDSKAREVREQGFINHEVIKF